MGLILFTTLLLSLLLLPVYKERYQPISNQNKISQENQIPIERQVYCVAAYAGIAAFAIMSLINFTIEAIPAMCMFIIFAAVLSVHPFHTKPGKQKNSPSPLFRPLHIPSGTKNVLAILLIGGGLYIGYTQVYQANAYLQNKAAADLGAKKQYNQANRLLQSLREPLQYSESYWRTMGNVLYAMNNYADAAKALERAKAFTSNPDIYVGTGKCYEKNGRYKEAEANYLTAANIEPFRFAPRFNLMNLYMHEGKMPQAQFMAKSILDLKPKIPSKEVQFCKNAAYRVLRYSVINNKDRKDGRIENHNIGVSP